MARQIPEEQEWCAIHDKIHAAGSDCPCCAEEGALLGVTMPCSAGCGDTPHRFRPSPEAGSFYRCSECGEPNAEPAATVASVPDDLDDGYSGTREAWASGYAAALHDVEAYAHELRPWWCPRWAWRRVAASVWRARRVGGDEL